MGTPGAGCNEKVVAPRARAVEARPAPAYNRGRVTSPRSPRRGHRPMRHPRDWRRAFFMVCRVLGLAGLAALLWWPGGAGVLGLFVAAGVGGVLAALAWGSGVFTDPEPPPDAGDHWR